MASNALLRFLLPMVLVIGIIVDAHANTDDTQLDESLQESLREEVSGENFCPPNEEFVACKSLCEFDCKKRNETSPVCDKLCVSSCRCEKGYVRGPKGTCIKPYECPDDDDTHYPVKRVCPINEEWNGRANCQTNCTYPLTRLCNIRIPVKGCICKKGFIRRSDGKCIPEYQCPKNDGISSTELLQNECPPREHWDWCKARCQRNCSNINDNPGICPGFCIPGCLCNTGFVRGPNGHCIKPKECPAEVKCPVGEHFDNCLFNCQRNCSNWNQRYIPCNAMCLPGCVCDLGTVRSELPSGKCIKPEECEKPNEARIHIPLLCKKKNEEWSPCSSSCPANCTNYQDKGKRCATRLCIPGCVCKSGFIKGPNGDCIKPDKCPKKPKDCAKQEYYYTCGTSCEDNCDNYQNPNRRCDKRCNIGCFCLPGYVRGPKGDCIWHFDCKTESSSVDYSLYDRLDEPTESEMLIRDEGSNFCPPHEEFLACQGLCELDCRTRNRTLPECDGWCVSSCRCESGYVRGPKGTCIKPDDCPENDPTQYPVERVCPANEMWSGFAHCQTNCTHPKPFLCPRIVVKGCICKKEFKRRPDGKCVPVDRCPPNEEDITDADSEELVDDPDTTHGCPNDLLCHRYCVIRGYSTGYCLLPFRQHCQCANGIPE